MVPFAFLMMLLVALLFTALGTTIASLLEDMQGFQLIMNFLVMPLFFFSGALFFDPTPAFRLGAEFAQTKTTLGDDSSATNNRGQFSAFYLF